MEDPYNVLGVAKDASEDSIRKAYRKLAKKHHPDVNPGKPDAVEKFQKASAAYEILSDKDKRARFDRGEIDAEGRERAQQPPPGNGGRGFYREYGDTPGAGQYSSGISPEDLEDLFGAFGGTAGGMGAGMGGGRRGANFRAAGQTMTYTLDVDFLDAANGTSKRLTLPGGKTLDVTIPAGIRDGHTLRLKGQGGPGMGGGPAGDALIEVSVTPHPFFRRDGDDVLLDLPVTVKEAVLGTAIEVPTIKGAVRVTVPPGSGTGTKLRLRGRGINGGNQFVEVKIVLPPGEEPALADFLRGWTPEHEFDPRAALGLSRERV